MSLIEKSVLTKEIVRILYSISKWEKENQFLISTTMILIEWLIVVWSSFW